MHAGCVFLGDSASPVLVRRLSQAQLPSTKAFFLSPAPVVSSPFTARLGEEVPRENRCLYQKELGVGVGQRTLGQAPNGWLPSTNFTGPGKKSHLFSEKWVAGG